MIPMRFTWKFAFGSVLLGVAVCAQAADLPAPVTRIIGAVCLECHDGSEAEGNLDLTALKFSPADPDNFATWAWIHDRVLDGEMPPEDWLPLETEEIVQFTEGLAAPLIAFEAERDGTQGRSTRRRLNNYEYENALRDLLGVPWMKLKESLPDDGEANRFNKIGTSLDVSHVQMARYIEIADLALRQALAADVVQPQVRTVKLYARESMRLSRYHVGNTDPERTRFPVLGALDETRGQPEARAGRAPSTVGEDDPEMRDQEAVGVVSSNYIPIGYGYRFRAPVSGRYKLRFSSYTIWVAPTRTVPSPFEIGTTTDLPDNPRVTKPLPGVDSTPVAGAEWEKWWLPDLDRISGGRRAEPVSVYARLGGNRRLLGSFDAFPEPAVQELDVLLVAGERIQLDAARLFRSRPANFRNPLATEEGQPGVAFRWMEAEGPLLEAWPPDGHRLMFGDLPLKRTDLPPLPVPENSGRRRRRNADPPPRYRIDVLSEQPLQDGERLLRRFLQAAYRGSVDDGEVDRFLPLIKGELDKGRSFTNAMIAAYTAVLASPQFLYVEEKPGQLDDHALATRLALFLINSVPDAQLRAVAAKGMLGTRVELSMQTDRLLDDPRSQRFVEAFLDYWLDLREIEAASPDVELYADYYLDDLLTESSLAETRLFFAELLHQDLPARNVISSDFSFLNERLATHYSVPGVDGVGLQRVGLPADSPRGGLLTQASVLRVTANGTTTSPVLRGVWILERILGKPVPPPPPDIPAVEPDTRGAVTIRQQIEKHRELPACATCHDKIDPVGFALESFDVMGGERTNYRALGGANPEFGFGHNGHKFTFHYAMPVDPSGTLPDGRSFHDVRQFKSHLLEDERAIARNLVQQLIIYATGAPVRFSDRVEIERILDRLADSDYGVRSMVHEIVQSDLFLNK
ncbi:MAG: DUF1592 domain-containing protein [Candidatus Latescibacteria bacterium]|nr:DUF1592 domain-containing protein [Candidatus Latescibacterota bacterium]